jgi:cytochrome c553
MHAHLDLTTEIHNALVRGSLAAARSGSNWIATHENTDKPEEGLLRYERAMATHAAEVRDASDLQEAAAAAARMASACGDCHKESGAEPQLLMGAPPSAGEGAKSEMALHVWASEQMWHGLVGPDDYAWTSGSSALKEGWLSPREVVRDPETRDQVRSLVQQVYSLGSRAETVSDPHERSEIYGEFLTTCIDCHQLTSAIIG